MALKDVKQYYKTMVKQYVDLKNDMNDFNEALKSGYITEDKLVTVTDEAARLKENVDRLAYILYLFEQPNRKSKKKKFLAENQKVSNYFSELAADEEAVKSQNSSIIAEVHRRLKTLTTKD